MKIIFILLLAFNVTLTFAETTYVRNTTKEAYTHNTELHDKIHEKNPKSAKFYHENSTVSDGDNRNLHSANSTNHSPDNANETEKVTGSSNP